MRTMVVVVGVAAFALAGCGGGTNTVTVTQSTSTLPTSEKQYTGHLPPGVTDHPSSALVSEWPERWCRVRIGANREQVSEIMGAVPTEADSGKMPLIPPIKLNARGENENEGPPRPAGSDTWQAPGSYSFNAFYDRALRVQQLDFEGPARELGCASIRVGG